MAQIAKELADSVEEHYRILDHLKASWEKVKAKLYAMRTRNER